jgi:hypothetical protein
MSWFAPALHEFMGDNTAATALVPRVVRQESMITKLTDVEPWAQASSVTAMCARVVHNRAADIHLPVVN